MVLSLLVIALIGANQTYALETTTTKILTHNDYLIYDTDIDLSDLQNGSNYNEVDYAEYTNWNQGFYKSLNEDNIYYVYLQSKTTDNTLSFNLNDDYWLYGSGIEDINDSYNVVYGSANTNSDTTTKIYKIKFLVSETVINWRFASFSSPEYLNSSFVQLTTDYISPETDLELTGITDGQSLTQDQDDVMNALFEPSNDVYLEIEGSTYELASRDGNVISETASSDGYSLDYTGGVVSLDYFGSSVDGATPFTLKVALSEENFSIMNVTEGDSLDFVDDYIMNEFLLSSDPIYLQIDGNDVILASRDGNVISETASSDGYSLDYSGGVITLDYYGSSVDAGTTFSLVRSLPPTISGSGVYLSDYDNPATVADVQATLTATDDPDGDLTSAITVYDDNFTGNETVLGNHDIVFQVEDAAGNVSQFTVTVSVVDITAPVLVLVGDASITLGIDETFTDPGVTVTDNVDSSPTWDYDGGSHGVDTSTPATYTVTYTSTDSAGNEATPITRTVIVEDTEAPYVQSNVSTITTYNSQNLTIDAVLSGITVVDDHDDAFDGTYTVTVDNYTGNESIEGSYDVTLTATDASGNVMTHVITIVVIDDVPPVISASDYLLTPEEVSAMSQAEIKAHIESRNP